MFQGVFLLPQVSQPFIADFFFFYGGSFTAVFDEAAPLSSIFYERIGIRGGRWVCTKADQRFIFAAHWQRNNVVRYNSARLAPAPAAGRTRAAFQTPGSWRAG
jgi:hypothetical protein